MTATHPDFAQGKASKTIVPEAVSPVRIEVSVAVPVKVAGQVLDGGGRPITGAWVSAQPEGEALALERTATDAEGRVVIEALAEGPFTLHANKEGFSAFEGQFDAAREDLVVTLQAVSPEIAARRAELQAKLMEIYGRLGSAANDKEREAITAEIQAVSAELQALNESSATEDR